MVVVRDVLGKEVQSIMAQQQLTVIDLPMQSGVYFVEVITSDGVRSTCKVLKQ